MARALSARYVEQKAQGRDLLETLQSEQRAAEQAWEAEQLAEEQARESERRKAEEQGDKPITLGGLMATYIRFALTSTGPTSWGFEQEQARKLAPSAGSK